MEEKNYEAIVEAILFTMGESVELEKIAAALELDKKETKKIIENLMKEYEKPSIGMKIIELDGAYQMCTKSEMYEYLIRIAKQPKKHVLTDVLLETLSIIAYKQPITKVEIEKIRGVSCDHAVIDAQPGRPLSIEKLPVRSALKQTDYPETMAEALKITAGEKEYVVILCHQEVNSPTDLVEADGCMGYGNVIVFDKAGDVLVGDVLNW